MRKGFIWMNEWSGILKGLSDAQIGRLFRAVTKYDAEGELSDMNDDPALRIAFQFIKLGVDANRDHYDEVCRKRAEVARRGRAKQMERSGQLPAIASNCQQKTLNINTNTNTNSNTNTNTNYATLNNACAREEGEDFDSFETFGELHNVKLTAEQYRHLQETYGTDQTASVINGLSCKLKEGSYQTSDHYATLLYWLSYRQSNNAGRVPMSSAQEQGPLSDEQELRAMWDTSSDQVRQEYLDKHDGKLPWEK